MFVLLVAILLLIKAATVQSDKMITSSAWGALLNSFCLVVSGGGTDRQGGRWHLHFPGGRHHGDAAEGGEADREGKGQREGRERKGSQTQQLTHLPQGHITLVKTTKGWPEKFATGHEKFETHKVRVALLKSHFSRNWALNNT